MFEAQPRSTLVCFTHDSSADDVSVGLRARALLLRDIYWCERDDSSDAPSEEEIGPDGRLAVASIPAVSLQPPPRADPPLQAAPQAPVLGRARWASAPEVETLVGELKSARENRSSPASPYKLHSGPEYVLALGLARHWHQVAPNQPRWCVHSDILSPFV